MNLKIGIIGCGRIAARHLNNINRVGVLSGLCDIDKSKAYALCNNTPAFTDLNDMMERTETNVVAVCSPNGLHCDHTIQALNAGCHVICEKPMALSTEECGRMLSTAERANRRIFVVKQNRFNPPIRKVKRLLETGDLGHVYSAQLNCFWNRNSDYYKEAWKGTRRLDGGTLFTQFSHFIDLLYWMLGDVEEICAFGANFSHTECTEFDDTGVVALRFASGTLATINHTINAYGKNMEGSITLFAENGTVKIGGQYLNELEYQSSDKFLISGLPEGKPPNQYGHYVGSMSNHSEVYDNIHAVLCNNAQVTTSGYEGLKTVEIIERIYKAAQGPNAL